MRLHLLRRGEYLALAGALGLALTMFLDWFDTPSTDPVIPGVAPSRVLVYADHEVQRSGWSAVGWLPALLAGLAIAACLFWLFALLAPDTPALPFAPDAVTFVLAALATLALATRLLFQPGLGAGLSDGQVDVLPIAYVGVGCAILLAIGAWLAISGDDAG